jgi:hypothetical protein
VVAPGLGLGAQLLEPFAALALLRLAGPDEPVVVERHADDLTGQADDLVRQPPDVLVVDTRNQPHCSPPGRVSG